MERAQLLARGQTAPNQLVEGTAAPFIPQLLTRLIEMPKHRQLDRARHRL